MVLADTSVWMKHFRRGDAAMHAFVAGGLACGNLKDRASILADLQTLPAAALASNAEVMQFIEDRKLGGRGLGWVDIHLLVSALLSNCRFWTLDSRLAKAAREFRVS